MTAWSRLKRSVTVLLAFVLGQVAWGVVAGAVAGAADSGGYAFPEATATTLAPIGGLLAAAYVVGVFD